MDILDDEALRGRPMGGEGVKASGATATATATARQRVPLTIGRTVEGALPEAAGTSKRARESMMIQRPVPGSLRFAARHSTSVSRAMRVRNNDGGWFGEN